MAARLLNEQIGMRGAETADKRIAALRAELGAIRERLIALENVSHSLRSALGLIIRENSRLSLRLTESDGKLGKAQAEIEQMKKAFIVAWIELKKLAADKSTANEKLKLVQHSLLAKERYIQQLEQSLAKPFESSAAKVLADTITF